jgi:hypothetical protein
MANGMFHPLLAVSGDSGDIVAQETNSEQKTEFDAMKIIDSQD